MEKLEIYYNNKKVENNDFLKPSETQIQPEIKYNYDPNNLYTLIMYDPDSVRGTHIHWLVSNIKNNINDGKILLPYEGPAPPVKTGKHRYIFELHKQQNMLNNKPFENRIITINSLKNLLNIDNCVAKLKFISQNETGGKRSDRKRRKTTKKIKINIKRKTRKY
jgi:phosphatidylethanolamine-binding protein (PEBP) family uncharacterized protein